MVHRMGGKAVKMFSESKLVVGQVKSELEARDERMQGYLSQVRHLQSRFESFSLRHVPTSGNTHANFLATLATSSTQLTSGYPYRRLVQTHRGKRRSGPC